MKASERLATESNPYVKAGLRNLIEYHGPDYEIDDFKLSLLQADADMAKRLGESPEDYAAATLEIVREVQAADAAPKLHVTDRLLTEDNPYRRAALLGVLSGVGDVQCSDQAYGAVALAAAAAEAYDKTPAEAMAIAAESAKAVGSFSDLPSKPFGSAQAPVASWPTASDTPTYRDYVLMLWGAKHCVAGLLTRTWGIEQMRDLHEALSNVAEMLLKVEDAGKPLPSDFARTFGEAGKIFEDLP